MRKITKFEWVKMSKDYQVWMSKDEYILPSLNEERLVYITKFEWVRISKDYKVWMSKDE